MRTSWVAVCVMLVCIAVRCVGGQATAGEREGMAERIRQGVGPLMDDYRCEVVSYVDRSFFEAEGNEQRQRMLQAYESSEVNRAHPPEAGRVAISLLTVTRTPAGMRNDIMGAQTQVGPQAQVGMTMVWGPGGMWMGASDGTLVSDGHIHYGQVSSGLEAWRTGVVTPERQGHGASYIEGARLVVDALVNDTSASVTDVGEGIVHVRAPSVGVEALVGEGDGFVHAIASTLFAKVEAPRLVWYSEPMEVSGGGRVARRIEGGGTSATWGELLPALRRETKTVEDGTATMRVVRVGPSGEKDDAFLLWARTVETGQRAATMVGPGGWTKVVNGEQQPISEEERASKPRPIEFAEPAPTAENPGRQVPAGGGGLRASTWVVALGGACVLAGGVFVVRRWMAGRG